MSRTLPACIFSATDRQLVQVQFQQVLKIGIEVFLGERRQKFSRRASVYLAYAVYQLPFTHLQTSLKETKAQ
jgi:hypothetical protein